MCRGLTDNDSEHYPADPVVPICTIAYAVVTRVVASSVGCDEHPLRMYAECGESENLHVSLVERKNSHGLESVRRAISK
jgi:hypothetical protein